MSIEMKENLKLNWGWIASITATVLSVMAILVGLGMAYNRLTSQNEATAKALIALTEIVKAQDARILKIEGGLSVMQQVEINTRRLDVLEKFTVESSVDRGKINTSIQDLKRSVDQVVSMHMKP